MIGGPSVTVYLTPCVLKAYYVMRGALFALGEEYILCDQHSSVQGLGMFVCDVGLELTPPPLLYSKMFRYLEKRISKTDRR